MTKNSKNLLFIKRALVLVVGLAFLGNLPVGAWSVCLDSVDRCEIKNPDGCCSSSNSISGQVVKPVENPICENCFQLATQTVKEFNSQSLPKVNLKVHALGTWPLTTTPELSLPHSIPLAFETYSHLNHSKFLSSTVLLI